MNFCISALPKWMVGVHLIVGQTAIQSFVNNVTSKNCEAGTVSGGYLFNVGFQYATLDERNTGQKFDCVPWPHPT